MQMAAYAETQEELTYDAENPRKPKLRNIRMFESVRHPKPQNM
jgi:hypothetical protein